MKITGFTGILTAIKTSGRKQNILNNTVKVSNQNDLFCHKYWDWAQKQGAVEKTGKEAVSLHGYLNGINHHFIHSPYPKAMDEKFFQTNMTPREMIIETDFDFKELKPTAEKLNVFRCIGQKPEFFSEYKLYQKRCAIKKGDIIDMKEYAYATSDINYAKGYLPDNKGIMYEIEIPKGARVSRKGLLGSNDEIVFPRSSKFECVNVKKVKDAENDYIHAKLRYILPDETWRIMA